MTVPVSVCLPAYRSEAFIGQAIESALVQTYADFELVIVDDHSPDDTYEIAAGYSDARIRLTRNDENLGAAGNWNHAVSLARGRYVKVLCSDDWLYPTCLEREVAALDHDPGAVLASCRRDIVDDAGRVLFADRGLKGLTGAVAGDRAVRATVRGGTNIIGEPTATLVRRDALEAAGPFDAGASYMVDLDMWCRLLARGGFVGVDATLCTFRVHPSSWSAALARRQAAEARALFRRLAADGQCSGADYLFGSAKATVLSTLRRLAFARAARRRARP